MTTRQSLLLRLAAAAIVWERFWPRAWLVLAVLGAFASTALLDLLPLLPGAVHTVLLVAFAVALAAAVGHAARTPWPVDASTARHRLERDSGLAHRPLSSLADERAVGDAGLWRAHLERSARAARGLRVRLPAPGVAARDPNAWRFLVILISTIAVVVGHDDAAGRLDRALTPQLGGAAVAAMVDAWITPPSYTGRPPSHLDAETRLADPLEVPEGSMVLTQVGGTEDRPRLVRDGAPALEFEPQGNGGWRLETEVTGSGRLTVLVGGRELAGWPVRLLDDGPPTVAFTADPAVVEQVRVRLACEARDDYGVTALTAWIRRPGEPKESNDEAISLDMTAPAGGRGRVSRVFDLTSHPWAGLAVEVRVEARDGRGQTVMTEPRSLVLPEREFHHPVARALVQERRRLLLGTPGARLGVARSMELLSGNPEAFDHDVTVALALWMARSRLLLEGDKDAVARLLWDVALHLEDGGLSLAENALDKARQRLREALSGKAPGEHLDDLLRSFQAEMRRYQEALAQELKRKGLTEHPEGPVEDMFAELTDAIREMMAAGDLDGAQRLLDILAQRIEGIRKALGGEGVKEDVARARALLRGLREVMKQQRELLDRTHERERTENRRGLPEDRSLQEDLRRGVGGMMLDMDALTGQIPDALGKAERAMKGAAHALGTSNLEGAVAAQGKAVEGLRHTLEDLAEALARSLGGIPSLVPDSEARDPFGRTGGGAMDLPKQSERRRAREILHELRRRADDPARPHQELEYIDRLLRRF